MSLVLMEQFYKKTKYFLSPGGIQNRMKKRGRALNRAPTTDDTKTTFQIYLPTSHHKGFCQRQGNKKKQLIHGRAIARNNISAPTGAP